MNQKELDALAKYTNTKTRVFFVLQLGYFKAKHQFYTFTFEDVHDDVDYVFPNFFNRRELKLSGRYLDAAISANRETDYSSIT